MFLQCQPHRHFRRVLVLVNSLKTSDVQHAASCVCARERFRTYLTYVPHYIKKKTFFSDLVSSARVVKSLFELQPDSCMLHVKTPHVSKFTAAAMKIIWIGKFHHPSYSEISKYTLMIMSM